ncbi:hypothetical protein, partial [Longivirga aurantiaca]
MKTRTSTRLPRTATFVAAAALAVGTLPALAASASAATVEADPTNFPRFGYITYDGGAHDATTDKLWVTDGSTWGPGTLLTPNSYAYSYDVSHDGEVLAVSGQSRALTVPALNTTYGLLVVDKNGPDPDVTTNVTTIVESNPVVSPLGDFVYWVDSGAIWRYVVDTGVTTKVSTNFAPKAGEVVGRLAISDNGAAAAVVFTVNSSSGALISSRIRAGRLDGVGTEKEYSQSVASGLSYPVGSTLVFTSDTEVAFNVWRSGNLTSTWSISGIGATAVADTSIGLGAVYDLSTDGTSWYSFQDIVSGTQVAKTVSPYDTGVFEDFPRGSGTVRYVPATTQPGVAAPTVDAVVNRASATSYLFLAKSAVPTGTKVMYASLAAYLEDATGTRGADVKAQTRYGQLKSSVNGGATFTTTATTGAGSRLLTWPTGAPFGNGYTAALTRNTWFQWCFQGDAYVAADCSITKKVTVNPTVSVGVQTSGSTKRVYGKAARTGGTAVLYRYVNGSWVVVTTAAVSSTGTFSFGFRTLPRGSYKATTKADTYWG